MGVGRSFTLRGGLAAAPIKQADQDQPEAIVRKIKLPTPPPDAPRGNINEPRGHQRAPSWSCSECAHTVGAILVRYGDADDVS